MPGKEESKKGSKKIEFGGKLSGIDELALLNSIDNTQQMLLGQIQDYEDRKLTIIKLILGLYGVLIPISTTLLTLYGVGSSTGNIFDNKLLMMVCGIGLMVIGALSLALLKYLIATKAGTAIIMRQINCNRQASHAIFFEAFDGVKTSTEEDFQLKGETGKGKIEPESYYNRMIYRHARLPIDNTTLRDKNCKLRKAIFVSPDGFLSFILSLLIIASFGSGAFALSSLGELLEDSFASGALSLGVVLAITILIYYILTSSWSAVRASLDCKEKV